jgi:hypothetical protein
LGDHRSGHDQSPDSSESGSYYLDVVSAGDGDLLLDHPAVGELDLRYRRFQIDGCPNQFLITLHADPETPSEHGLRLLSDFASPA